MKSADRCHLHLLLSNMDCEAVGKSDFPRNDSEKEIFKLLCSIWLDNAAHARVSNMHVMAGSHSKVFKLSLNRGVKAFRQAGYVLLAGERRIEWGNMFLAEGG